MPKLREHYNDFTRESFCLKSQATWLFQLAQANKNSTPSKLGIAFLWGLEYQWIPFPKSQ